MSTSRQSAGSPCLLKILLDEIAPETSPGPAFRNSGTPSGHIKPQSAASRKLTARALEIYLGHKPSPEVLSGLARTPQGKPYFPGYPDFKYNISHSGRYAVCGMICGGRDPQPVGIDIQEIPSDPERALKIADRFFSEPERESLHELVRAGDSTSALLLFCRYWTARESYIKLTGRGLAELFHSYRPDLDRGRIITADPSREIYLTECPAPEGYCLTVCSFVPLKQD